MVTTTSTGVSCNSGKRTTPGGGRRTVTPKSGSTKGCAPVSTSYKPKRPKWREGYYVKWTDRSFSQLLGVEKVLSGPYRNYRRADVMLDIARYTYGDKKAEIIKQYLPDCDNYIG